MKVNLKSINFFAFLLFFSFNIQAANTQAGKTSEATVSTYSLAEEETMMQPSDLFQNFPEIKWGMSIQDAKKAIEKTGTRAIRPIETEVAWVGKFDNEDGRGALRFMKDAGLDEVVVQLYYSDQGKQMFEAWLKKLTDRHGETKEGIDSEDQTSKVWRFKNGFSVELRLLKGEGENRYMADLHWVKS